MPDVLLVDAARAFLDSLRAAKKSDHTVAAYRRDLEAVAELLVDPIDKSVVEIRLSDATASALRQAFGTRASMSAAATVARTHSTWSRFFRFCPAEGLVDANPMDEIERAKVGTGRPRSIETPDVAQRLLTAAAQSQRAPSTGVHRVTCVARSTSRPPRGRRSLWRRRPRTSRRVSFYTKFLPALP